VGPECATIAREKFLDITIDFLQSRDVLMEYNDEACRADPRWAHLIMAVLAHCCSSDGLPAITTDKTQFTLQMRSLGSVLHADPNKADEAVDDRATAVSMLLARIPLPKAEGRDDRFLRQVLQARAEDEVTGHREKFRATIDKYCERLRQAQCEAEVNDLLREFDDAADRDSKVLVRELRRIGVGCLVSKDGAIALLLGMAAGNLAPGIGHVVGAILGWKTYRNARRGVLRNHWSSWLYRVQHGKYTYY
jgi:hypothetical protein